MGNKTKIVLDTNIWISIFFNKTLNEEFGDLFRSGKIEVFVSEEILKEIARVLEYPKIKTVPQKAGMDSKEVLKELSGLSEVVNPKKKSLQENLPACLCKAKVGNKKPLKFSARL